MADKKLDYRKLKVGDKVDWVVEEPWDMKPRIYPSIVTDVSSERAMAVVESDKRIHLWIDDDTAPDYRLAG